MQFNITVSGIEEIQRTLHYIDERFAPSIIKETTLDAFKNIKKRAIKHTQTGNMEDNLSFKVHNSSGEVYIEDNGMMVEHKGKKVNYATFVLYGTRKHDIAPKDKKSLRFSSVGAFVHAKLVHHPGYKGDNFLYDGAQDTFKKLDKIIDKVVENGL